MSGLSSIKQSGRVREVVRGGSRLRSGPVSTAYLRSSDGVFRLCVIVPASCGNAVKRNRMRRVIREACRREARKTGIPCSVVVTFRGTIRREDYAKAAGITGRFMKEIAEKR